MKKLLIGLVFGLTVLGGACNVTPPAKQAQTQLTSIEDHATAARTYMKPDLNRPNIKAADAEVSQIPPEAEAAGADIEAMQKQYDQLNNKWYVKLGRKLEAIFWTLVICSVVACFALAAINFYTGGLVGSSFVVIVFNFFKGIFQKPIEFIHNTIASIITSISTHKAVTQAVKGVSPSAAPAVAAAVVAQATAAPVATPAPAEAPLIAPSSFTLGSN